LNLYLLEEFVTCVTSFLPLVYDLCA
jgi:hypothetical protein